ncbi:hypothetical protein F7I80_21510 [Salmonella enterica]|nr:hypothetical protein [Salmonella enterica]
MMNICSEASVLPVSRWCEHLRGHGGGRASVRQTHARLLSGRYPFVFRTDIRGYYARISKTLLYEQLCRYVSSPVLRDLLCQFLHYSVEDGGEFHTPLRGIPRGSALSPLLAAFHLTETDNVFSRNRHVTYVRYMDDFLILSPTRWHLRRAVRMLNRHFAQAGFEQHPDKTFIGRVEKGFDWMGFWFTEKGCDGVAPRALQHFKDRLRRLYEQLCVVVCSLQALPNGRGCPCVVTVLLLSARVLIVSGISSITVIAIRYHLLQKCRQLGV